MYYDGSQCYKSSNAYILSIIMYMYLVLHIYDIDAVREAFVRDGLLLHI